MTETSDEPTLYDLLGGRAGVEALAHRFYDWMDDHEPALAALHELDDQGKVAAGPRERFAMFLVGWVGGPQDYMATHGHPRLRMRHARVRVDVAMRDAWLRSMEGAMDAQGVHPDARRFLSGRFAQVADFLRNVPE
jgi:hemoglobin